MRGQCHHLVAKRAVGGAVFVAGHGVGHAVGGEGGAEQQRAVAHLAPEVAPDVVGGDGFGFDQLQKAMHLGHAVAHAPVEFPHSYGGAVAEEDAARLQPVGAVVDETAHRVLGPDARGDDLFVEPVLGRDDIAARREMGGKHLQSGGGVVRLHAEENAVVLASQFVRRAGREDLSKCFDRAFNAQSAAAHGFDMLFHDIDHMHDMTRAGEIGAEDAADGTGAPDQDRGLAHAQSPSSCARVSRTAISHRRSVSASGFW